MNIAVKFEVIPAEPGAFTYREHLMETATTINRSRNAAIQSLSIRPETLIIRINLRTSKSTIPYTVSEYTARHSYALLCTTTSIIRYTYHA